MSRVAVDFGTSNSVIARLRDDGACESLEIPGVTTALQVSFGGTDDRRTETVHLAPSVIHYGDGETLIGRQVAERGLLDDPATFRWMKRAIATGNAKRRKTKQGHRDALQAGTDYLRLLLSYASDQLSFATDEFTFTVPIESFEDFRDWLQRSGEALGIRRLRLIDEATAAILSERRSATKADRFLLFDFGCGTLDVSAVRLDWSARKDRTAVQLGQAGDELGGMDVDRWIAEDFLSRHPFSTSYKKRLQPRLLLAAEEAKIKLSDPECVEATLSLEVSAADLPSHDDGTVSAPRSTYRKECARCQSGAAPIGNADGCLGCILEERGAARRVRETVERALENAAIKVGLRRSELTAVLTTGGSSLLPSVRRWLQDTFAERLQVQNPFSAMVEGACRGEVAAVLQHDYAIESYSPTSKTFEFKPLFAAGSDYPTAKDGPRLWARGSYDGMTRIGIQIFEVSRLKRNLGDSLVSEDGNLKAMSRVSSEYRYVALNAENPTFIVADPPVELARDAKRFLCAFQVDANRHLLVTVLDTLTRKTLLDGHSVVRL